MCLGIPMQVITCESQRALCRRESVEQWIDLSLVGCVAEGDWVLTFMGAAREVITAERAEQINQALTAVESVMHGGNVDMDSLFADLVEREPQLPPHLQELKS